MSRRNAVAALAALAALAAVLRRRRGARRERITIGYEDGSAFTLEAGTDAADRFLALARPVLRR
jgi:hypothetical protein